MNLKAYLNKLREPVTDRFGIELFLLLCIITFFFRTVLAARFHFNISDADQLILWNGLVDYAHGIFREPFFYGQSYNPMVEAFLAIPLSWIGLAPKHALPIITLLLSLFPFLAFSIPFLRNGKWISACILVAWPSLMPLEYSVLANLPRGFMAGITIASLVGFFSNKPTSTGAVLMATICFPLAVIACPNSVLLIGFVFPYFWFPNRKNVKFYVSIVVTGIVTYLLLLSAQSFYSIHPERLVHTPWSVYKPVWIWAAIRDAEIGTMMNSVLPFINKSGSWVFPMLLFLTMALAALREKAFAFGMICCAGICLVAFGHSRLYSGSEHVFFAFTRHWLAIPVVLAIAAALVFKQMGNTKLTGIILIISVTVNVAHSLSSLPDFTKNALDPKQSSFLEAFEIEKMEAECADLKLLAENNQAELIMLSPFTVTRACPVFEPDFPPIVTNISSDRLWHNLVTYTNKPLDRILLYGSINKSMIPMQLNHTKLKANRTAFLIEGFRGTPIDLLDTIGTTVDSTRKAILLSESVVEE